MYIARGEGGTSLSTCVDSYTQLLRQKCTFSHSYEIYVIPICFLSVPSHSYESHDSYLFLLCLKVLGLRSYVWGLRFYVRSPSYESCEFAILCLRSDDSPRPPKAQREKGKGRPAIFEIQFHYRQPDRPYARTNKSERFPGRAAPNLRYIRTKDNKNRYKQSIQTKDHHILKNIYIYTNIKTYKIKRRGYKNIRT